MKRMKILFLFLGLFSLKSIDCVQAMIGGNLTEHVKFPYTVFIHKKHMDGNTVTTSDCGGSILDDNHVISAAHCFFNEKSKQWSEGSYLVIAGATNNSIADRINWVTRSVQKIFIPKMFNDSLEKNDLTTIGDIAVLRLDRSLNLMKNSHLSAVQLPKNVPYVNITAVVTGYGFNQIGFGYDMVTGRLGWNGISDGKLRMAETTVLSNSDCQRIWDNAPSNQPEEIISKEHICAQVRQRDVLNPEGICRGDSGGPLIYNGNILIGIANTTPRGCIENEVPGGYARVSAFINFIEKARNLKNNDDYRDQEILTKKPPVNPRSFFIKF